MIVDKNNSIGSRLIEAFGTGDKALIAEKLGFSSVQAVYKVINGKQELDFQKLQNFRNYTKCSIDWLLTGDGPRTIYKEFNVERSIELHDDWFDVLKDWYEFEQQPMPEYSLGASLMGGWATLTSDKKADALRELKRLWDFAAKAGYDENEDED